MVGGRERIVLGGLVNRPHVLEMAWKIKTFV